MEKVLINAVPVLVQMDTGSNLSIINKETAKQIWNIKPEPAGQVKLYNLESVQTHPFYYAQVKQAKALQRIATIVIVESIPINIIGKVR